METITKVIVARKEPKHTPAGQRNRIIQLKALLFVSLWDFFKNERPKKIRECFDEYAEYAISNAGIEKTDNNKKYIQDALGELKKDVFIQPKRVWLLRCLENNGYDLMFGKDETLASKLISIIQNNNKITSKEYIRNVLSQAHLTFYAIGRERKWNYPLEIITPEFGQDKPVVNAGNPMTTSVRDDVKSAFDNLDREHRFSANVQVNGVDTNVVLEKHGLPASVAVIYYVMVHMLQKILDAIKRLNDTKRMVNMAHLMLLWTITLHEGSRPGDTINGTFHKDFVFRFGKEYNMLVLAFVSAPTLAYLLESNHLKRFRFESFKGKRVKEYRGRWHSWFPWEYNSIDLAFIYILVMRVIAFVDPSNIQKKVFHKKTTNLSDIRKQMNKSLGIEGLVMYSIRYALCEESLSYATMIPGQWIKYVMGHVKDSFMRHRYGDNANQRVSIDNTMTLLGGDVSSSVTDDNIPIGFHPYNDNRMDAVLDGTPQHMIDELDAVQKEISMWFESSVESVNDVKSLIRRIPKTHNEFFDDLAQLPFGAHFGFQAGVLSSKMETQLSKTIQDLKQDFFRNIEIPQTTDKVIIWSYGQVMFGEWHKSNHAQAKREYESMQARQFVATLQQAIMKIDCGVLPEAAKGRSSVKRQNVGEHNKAATKKPRHSISYDKSVNDNANDTCEFIGFNARMLEQHDVVFIKCSSRDKWSIKVPNTTDYVWVCHIVDVEIPKSKNARVRVLGNFYTGELSKLVYDSNSSQFVKVCDEDLVYVMNGLSKEDILDLQLEDDEVDEVVRFWGR